MGPFNEQRQQHRAEAVAEILSNPNLSPWAEQYWLRVLAELAHNEDVYNYRVANVYKNSRRSNYE